MSSAFGKARALRLPVRRVYPLPQLLAAAEEAARETRAGKVLIALRVRPGCQKRFAQAPNRANLDG